MAQETVDCDVGIFTKTQCHLSSFTNNKNVHNLESLPDGDILNLKYRIDNYYEISKGNICDHHKCVWLDYYSNAIRKCCDPFKKHDKVITKDLRILKLQTCEMTLIILLMKLKPGDKICKRCETVLNSKIDSAQNNAHNLNKIISNSSSNATSSLERREKQEKVVSNNDNVLHDSQILDSQNSIASSDITVSNSSDFTTLSQEQRVVNSVLDNLDMPSWNNLTFHKSRRIRDGEIIVQDVCKHFTEHLSKASNVNITVPEAVCHNILEDCSVFRELLTNLQNEFQSAKTMFKKLELLALLPKHWGRCEIRLHFNCTDYMYKKLNQFKEMDDFPDNIKSYKRQSYTKMSTEMQQCILNYYQDDANTYTCPGKKEFVSTVDKDGKNIFIQKKLLLYTVYDLYLKFLDQYTGNEKSPSFSYFMSLKPIECIHAGNPGSHTICVCAEHQNVKLKLYALSRKLHYRDILEGAVCDVDNENCMIKKCNKCPGQSGVLRTFENLVKELDLELENEQIKYKNWVDAGSAASLESFVDTLEHLKTQLCEDINKLTLHHYIADAQKQYLNHCKSNLELDTCIIIIMDFSENYSFIIQQSVQAFYYNNSQATIHPFCIYYKTKNSDELLNVNYCVISDSKDHFAYTINAFTEKLMSVMKEEYSWIENIIYFSDGAPQQYKNKNHLANILCHEKDFGIKVKSYNFFGTSHGKSPCDAIGGNLKRQVMCHCIRSPPEGQITNAREMYEYATKEAKTIRVLWVSQMEVQKYEKRLRKRFTMVSTFPNTRLHHCYIPVEGKSMIMKVTSFSTNQKTITLDLK